MSQCEHCPVVGRCVAVAKAHAAYCDWARAGGKWRLRVVELSADLDADAPDPPRPGADEATAAAVKARSCPYRSKDLDCGCNGHRCGLRRPGPAQVVPLQTCIECIRRYG